MVHARHSAPQAERARTKDDPTDRLPRVTVLTLTYNRGHTLPRVFDSLCSQTYRDFEWLVIDDGSDDGTAHTVERWRHSSPGFEIRYHWQPNAGKHIAHNRGVELARGEFCSIIDSDDWYVATALERLVSHWDTLPLDERPKFANVEGLCMFADATIVGSRFPQDVFDSDNLQIRFARERTGDTRGMYRTDVLRSHPFPQDFVRAYVPESLVWDRIAQHYRTRFVNEVVGYTEYQAGGLSDLPSTARCSDPGPWVLVYSQRLEMRRRLPATEIFRSAANYLRFSLHAGVPLRVQFVRVPSQTLYLLGAPAGVALYLRDRWHVRDSG
jgi:glycosyltransferase involved in cell wall biosynthesis